MAERCEEEAFRGFAGNDCRAARAAAQKALAIEERDVAVLQFLVMAAETAPLEDGSDAFVKELRVPYFRHRRLPGRHERGSEDRPKPGANHYCFIPTPN